MKNYPVYAIMILLFTSCSHQLHKKSLVESAKMQAQVLNNDASRRNAYFIYDVEKNKAVTLSEPPPDAIVSQITSLTNKLKAKTELDTEQSVAITENIIQLGQRTVAVNILRDALFRLNELNVNNQNTPMDASSKELFDRILSVSEKIALADEERAKAQNKEAEAKLVQQKTENTIANANLLKWNNAQSLEDQAFNYLKNRDLNNAIQSFETIEKNYPTYHNAYEIYEFLKKYKNTTLKEEDWNTIFQTINAKYLWGMPSQWRNNLN